MAAAGSAGACIRGGGGVFSGRMAASGQRPVSAGAGLHHGSCLFLPAHANIRQLPVLLAHSATWRRPAGLAQAGLMAAASSAGAGRHRGNNWFCWRMPTLWQLPVVYIGCYTGGDRNGKGLKKAYIVAAACFLLAQACIRQLPIVLAHSATWLRPAGPAQAGIRAAACTTGACLHHGNCLFCGRMPVSWQLHVPKAHSHIMAAAWCCWHMPTSCSCLFSWRMAASWQQLVLLAHAYMGQPHVFAGSCLHHAAAGSACAFYYVAAACGVGAGGPHGGGLSNWRMPVWWQWPVLLAHACLHRGSCLFLLAQAYIMQLPIVLAHSATWRLPAGPAQAGIM
jgi:hypothetical protein